MRVVEPLLTFPAFWGCVLRALRVLFGFYMFWSAFWICVLGVRFGFPLELWLRVGARFGFCQKRHDSHLNWNSLVVI